MFDDDLVCEIYACSKQAFSTLFEEKHDENFYYCVLVTTEEGHPPFLSAWSEQALAREKQKGQESEEYFEYVRWSYADSPYIDYAGDAFAGLQAVFGARPGIESLDSEGWLIELDSRIIAMERAMSMLDSEGIFSKNQPRRSVLINVELIPPTYSNTERALRLNGSANSALIRWLEEAAEKPD
ncbi:DUF4303 domain-containing protein [Xanthomonas cerealis]|uniref:DUF4303 domain-containing protein n=1 Tax=Xanthomonas cerealis TaxID=3390025 RepID=UPI0009B8E539|nr:DUF4303 domain-containing protein [Xanthomonas translucens]UKE45872.1 DUF4303 domain-containing protein [Xanthomonas translucens pv. cerealis]